MSVIALLQADAAMLTRHHRGWAKRLAVIVLSRGMQAVVLYRVAHALRQKRVPGFPADFSELSQHPHSAAKIGSVLLRLRHGLAVELVEWIKRETMMCVRPRHLNAEDRGRLDHPRSRLLGAATHSEVPGYLAGFDATKLPHVVGAFTTFLDPVKLRECSALGKAILSKRVAGFRNRPELLTLCDDAAAERLVGEGGGRRHLQGLVAGESWGLRARTVASLLIDPLEARERGTYISCGAAADV